MNGKLCLHQLKIGSGGTGVLAVQTTRGWRDVLRHVKAKEISRRHVNPEATVIGWTASAKGKVAAGTDVNPVGCPYTINRSPVVVAIVSRWGRTG